MKIEEYEPKIGDKVRIKTLEEMRKTPGLEKIHNEDRIFRLSGKVFKVLGITSSGKERFPSLGRAFWRVSIRHGDDQVRSLMPTDLLIKLS